MNCREGDSDQECCIIDVGKVKVSADVVNVGNVGFHQNKVASVKIINYSGGDGVNVSNINFKPGAVIEEGPRPVESQPQ